ncbi:MAG: GNAT family N-acetyltransferase [Oscillospiraceae bacterium]|nr:GNAT family N-acetyltransferase [Oscillospiraceae bacterium]
MKMDFPPDELKPFSSIRLAFEAKIYECFGLFSDSTFLGYAFYYKYDENYLLDYFAIKAGERGRGFGSLFLSRLSELLSKAACVICEAEDPAAAETPETLEIRNRRIQFYLSNGFQETGITSRVFGAEYRLLVISASKSYRDAEIAEIYSSIYNRMLPENLYRTCFDITCPESL